MEREGCKDIRCGGEAEYHKREGSRAEESGRGWTCAEDTYKASAAPRSYLVGDRVAQEGVLRSVSQVILAAVQNMDQKGVTLSSEAS